jgi:hypothetical protein
MTTMPGPFLFSAMPYMKFYIYRTYRNDIHYVWCSEVYDHSSTLVPRTSLPSPPSSDPADICRQVRHAIDRRDRHDHRLTGWKTILITRVAAWEADGSLDPADAQELVFMLNSDDFQIWRPLLYVIHRSAIDPGRIHSVPPAQRAGFGREFVIEDLAGSEFEPLEI